MSDVLFVAAPAKVNLALSVGPPLPASAGAKAGFHPIASWFAPLDLRDDIEVQPLAHGPSRFEITWAADAPRPSPIDWPIERDLAFRAHAALETALGRALPVYARVSKRIPVGGGLGGGSSDAAAMLLAVDRAFDLRLGHARLSTLGQTLGSDVAFFLDSPPSTGAATTPPRPAIVTGLGETIERTGRLAVHSAPAAWLVLVLPPFGCATGAVYRAFDALVPGPVREDAVRTLAASPWPPIERGEHGLFNDLTAAACTVEPRLAEVMRTAERALARPVHMTGSGSTLFVLASSEADALALTRAAHTALAMPAVAARLV